jgi:5-methylcytosine-specific restriction endonuclease McrA
METSWAKRHPEETRASYKKWYEANREKVRVLQKNYRDANPDKRRASCKKYADANPEKVRASCKNWVDAHPEKLCAYVKKYREANPEKVHALWKKWADANPENIRTLRAIGRARRKQRLSLVIRERIDPFEILERDKWKCRKCGVSTPRELRGTRKSNAPVVDHVIPLKLGGPHTRTNMQCLCYKCNATKSAKYEGQLAFL